MVVEYPILTPHDAGLNWMLPHHHDSYPFIANSNHKGNAVFITGGARGIGRDIALSFAKAGASKIAMGDIRDFGDFEQVLGEAAKSKGHEPPQCILSKLNVTDDEAVGALAERVKKEFDGQLDVIVNNAGDISERANVVDMDPKGWWRCCAVNLFGVFNVAHYFVPILLAYEKGLKTMINLNSVASLGVRPYSSDYAASKAAVLKFSEMLMVEEAPRGLLVISLHPGAVLSLMTKQAMPEAIWDQFEDQTPLAGDTIAWLTSERREWLAGRWISCNWDMEQLLKRQNEIVKDNKLKIRLVT